MSSSPSSNPNSDTGLASHLASGIAALVPPITGLIFYLIEKKDSLARHWAVQSIFFGCVWIVLWIAYWIVAAIFVHIPILGPLLMALVYFVLWIGGFILWLLGVINAFQAKKWEYPIVSAQCKKLFPKLVP
ncbi:MAG: DUF4870 domain-containing protein [Chthoniobacterales bacterium]|jgi:uncharacterized membrane protein